MATATDSPAKPSGVNQSLKLWVSAWVVPSV